MKKYAIAGIALALVATGTIMGTQNVLDNQSANTLLSEVESLTNCESIDYNRNNGHCVHNDKYVYFCATAGLFQSKNCRMN